LPPPPDGLGGLGGLNGPKGGNLPPPPDGLQGPGGGKLPPPPDGLKPPGLGDLPPLDGLAGPTTSELSPPLLNPPSPQLSGLPAGLPSGLSLGKPGGKPGGAPGGAPGGLPSGLDGVGLPELSDRTGTEVSGLGDALSPVTDGLPGLDQDDRRLGTGMPGMPMSPMSPGSQSGGGAERPDAAGLLAGSPEEWEAMAGPGVGDPIGSDTPAVTPAEWAADSDVAGTPRVPGMPGMPMSGSPAGQGNGGSERPDAAGLLAGEPESWEAVAGPDVGDPVGSDTPAVTPAEWATREPAGQVVPGMPGMPMMPMSGSPAAQGGGGSERPDAAGLLAGEPESWEAVAGPHVGDPVGSDTPAVTPAEWATQEPVGQVGAGMPMMPVPVVAPPLAPASPPAASPSPRRAVAGSPRAADPAPPEKDPFAPLPGSIGSPSEFGPAGSEVAGPPEEDAPSFEPSADAIGSPRGFDAGQPDVVEPGEKDDDPSFPFAVPLAGPRSRRGDRARRPPPEPEEEVRVPVVRHTDDEDFSAWDAPSQIFGGGLARPAAGERPAVPEPQPSTSDESDEVPVRYRRGPTRRDEGPRPSDEPVLCGADEAPPVEEDTDEDTGDDEEPRTMADLLTLHNSAWSKDNTAPSGVLD